MSRPSRTLLILAAACSAIGLGGVGLHNPPTDSHSRPVLKEPPRLPSVAPREKAKPPAPATKPEMKPAAPVKPGHQPDSDHHDDQHTPGPVHADSHETIRATEPAPLPAPVVKSAPGEKTDGISADAALQVLREGNERWINNQAEARHTDTARREETAQSGQKPFATILTCADSRLPVERIFDRGVGDLFVVRVAGNVVSGEVAGTIEYGAEHLSVPLLVVMGHTKCGAVAAAAAGAAPEGNIGLLIEKITPAVARAKQQSPGADGASIVAASVKENVLQSMFDLFRSSAEVRHMIKDGKVRVVGAVCDVATGRVEWIGQHPWQDDLVDAFDAKAAPRQTETAGAESHH